MGPPRCPGAPQDLIFVNFGYMLGLFFDNGLAYFGVVFVMCLFFLGCCLISLFGPVGNNAGNNSDNNAGDNAGNYAGNNAGNNVGTNAGNTAGGKKADTLAHIHCTLSLGTVAVCAQAHLDSNFVV